MRRRLKALAGRLDMTITTAIARAGLRAALPSAGRTPTDMEDLDSRVAHIEPRALSGAHRVDYEILCFALEEMKHPISGKEEDVERDQATLLYQLAVANAAAELYSNGHLKKDYSDHPQVREGLAAIADRCITISEHLAKEVKKVPYRDLIPSIVETIVAEERVKDLRNDIRSYFPHTGMEKLEGKAVHAATTLYNVANNAIKGALRQLNKREQPDSECMQTVYAGLEQIFTAGYNLQNLERDFGTEVNQSVGRVRHRMEKLLFEIRVVKNLFEMYMHGPHAYQKPAAAAASAPQP